MKKILYLLLLFPLVAFGQESREKFSPLSYTDVVKAADPELSKDEMFTRILSWVNTSFKSANAVIDEQNKAAGVIIIKGVVPFHYKTIIKEKTGEVRYTLAIEIRPGRARLRFYGYSGKSADGSIAQTLSTDSMPEFRNTGIYQSSYKRAWTAAKEAAQRDHDDTINTITVAINKKEDNW